MADPNGEQLTARNILIGVLALGIALIALVLVLSLGKNTAPADQPPPRLTNTPNIGAGGITAVDPGEPVPDFTLPASTGGDLSLSDLAGQYVLLYLGYTECPDYCPLTMAKWVQVEQGLSEDEVDDIAYVMLSIDPRRDTPQVLADYLGQFDPAFIGLQGDEDTLRALAPLLGLSGNGVSGAEVTESAHEGMDIADHGAIPTYLVDHTIASYLIDPAGNLRAIFTPETPANDIRAFLEAVRYTDEASASS